MKRRKAIQGILLFSLGTGIVYSCTDEYDAVHQLDLKIVRPNRDQLDLISDFTNRILPIQSIEALAQHTALPFILKMVELSEEVEIRDRFIAAYKDLGSRFQNLEDSDQEATFLSLLEDWQSDDPELSKDIILFFDLLKKHSIIYVVNTEYIQRKVRYYQMAPGYYKGDIALVDWTNKNEGYGVN